VAGGAAVAGGGRSAQTSGHRRSHQYTAADPRLSVSSVHSMGISQYISSFLHWRQHRHSPLSTAQQTAQRPPESLRRYSTHTLLQLLPPAAAVVAVRYSTTALSPLLRRQNRFPSISLRLRRRPGPVGRPMVSPASPTAPYRFRLQQPSLRPRRQPRRSVGGRRSLHRQRHESL
jgi:hypothetical protein